MSNLQWSPQQETALKNVKRWLETQNQPVYRLFGFAGTGKTTIARHLAEGIDGEAQFGAYTGKAALVMRQKGIENAGTIHSLVYKLIPPDEAKLSELKKKKRKTSDPNEIKQITTEMRKLSEPRFEVNRDNSPLLDASLIVLDECSMVDDEMAEDVLSFEKPVLVLGDPGQLPPIHGEGAFTRQDPDTLLTEIHRQALDSPVIKLSMLAREGERIPFDTFGSSKKLRRTSFRLEHIEDINQVICGKNITRRNINKKWRYHKEYDDDYPLPSEKLICLKNSTAPMRDEKDKESPGAIFNGQTFYVESAEEVQPYVALRLTDESNNIYVVEAHCAYFDEYSRSGTLDNFSDYDMRGFHRFDYGYAITCHKSQGSQWKNILIYDDKLRFRTAEDRRRWLYTAITRAEESVTIVDAG